MASYSDVAIPVRLVEDVTSSKNRSLDDEETLPFAVGEPPSGRSESKHALRSPL